MSKSLSTPCSTITLVRAPNTHHSSLSTHHFVLGPFQCAFAPRVIVTNYQNTDEDKHLNQRKFCEGKIVAHENDGPWQQKDRLHVEDQKQHGDDIVTNRESRMRVRSRIDATLVWPHLSLPIFCGTQKPSQNNRQNWKGNGHHKEDHHRPVSRDWCADVLGRGCR